MENKKIDTKDVIVEENFINVNNLDESKEVNDIEDTTKEVFSDVYSIEEIEAAITNA